MSYCSKFMTHTDSEGAETERLCCNYPRLLFARLGSNPGALK